MSLEKDLDKFWQSYLPVIALVEAASPESNLDELRSQVENLLSEIQLPEGWQTKEKITNNKWYDELLVTEIEIPYNNSDGHLILKPKYHEFKDGKIVWDSEDRQKERDGTARGGRPVYDLFLDFKPSILPDWQEKEDHHLPDYRFNKSSVGRMDAELETGNASFCSYERSKFLEEERKKPEWTTGENGWPEMRKIPKARLIKVQLGYPDIDGMSDDEMGAAMSGMFRGYTYVTNISFRAKDVGSGEINRFLQHLEIEYRKE